MNPITQPLKPEHLGEHVDVRQLQVQHGAQGQQQRGQVLGRVTGQVRVHQVHGSQPAAR